MWHFIGYIPGDVEVWIHLRSIYIKYIKAVELIYYVYISLFIPLCLHKPVHSIMFT